MSWLKDKVKAIVAATRKREKKESNQDKKRKWKIMKDEFSELADKL